VVPCSIHGPSVSKHSYHSKGLSLECDYVWRQGHNL
jgi:hypothetical protein